MEGAPLRPLPLKHTYTIYMIHLLTLIQTRRPPRQPAHSALARSLRLPPDSAGQRHARLEHTATAEQ